MQELQSKAVELLLASELPTSAQLIRVSEIKFADDVDTAAMIFHPRTGKATIHLNREFVSQYAETPLRLGALLMHELMHHMLHHYVLYPNDKITNIAQDMLINALICRLASNFQQLFTETYTKNIFPWMVLRPGGNVKRIKDSQISQEVMQVYKRLYRKYNRTMGRSFQNGGEDPDVFTVDDLRSLLITVATLQEKKQKDNLAKGLEEMFELDGLDPDWWKEDEPPRVVLLGKHGEDPEDQLSSAELDEEHKEVLKDLLDGMVGELSANPNAKGLFSRGFGIDKEDAPDELLEAMANGLREDVMRCKEIVETVIGARLSRTGVVPKHFTRKEVALLAAGVMPVFWPAFGPDEKPEGDVRVYIDVSGSMGDQAGFVLMLMANFKEQIDTEFYQFSTEIAPTPYAEFLKHFEETGEVIQTTTGGTDFDPIFKHADENGFKKIVLITDGCAGLSPEGQMIARSIETFTVFTENHSAEPLTDVSKQTWVMPRIKIKPKKQQAA